APPAASARRTAFRANQGPAARRIRCERGRAPSCGRSSTSQWWPRPPSPACTFSATLAPPMLASSGSSLTSKIRMGGQNLVQRSRTIAFQVERHVPEPQALENAGQPLGHFLVERALKLAPGDLDADDLLVEPHPHLPEPEPVQRLLAFLDPRQHLRRHRDAVGHARRQAGLRRAVPNLEPGRARAGPNLGLPSPASSSGARTPCAAAARWPGRKSSWSSAFTP